MRPHKPCCRCCLTSLHVIACVTAGFYVIWQLLHRQEDVTCLIKSAAYVIVDGDVADITCDVILYTSAVVVAWSLFSIVMVTACNFRPALGVMQVLLSSVLGLLFLAVGCLMTIDFVQWCRSIVTCDHSPCPPLDCLEASLTHNVPYGNSTTVNVFWNGAIELACLWVLAPAVVILALCYTASIWVCRPKDPALEQPACQGQCHAHGHAHGHAHEHGQAHEHGHAHEYDHAHGPGCCAYLPPPPSYYPPNGVLVYSNPTQAQPANASNVYFNPEPRPFERQTHLHTPAAVTTAGQAAAQSTTAEEDVPLLIDLRESENHQLLDVNAGAVGGATAPLSESGHAHYDDDTSPLLGGVASGGRK